MPDRDIENSLPRVCNINDAQGGVSVRCKLPMGQSSWCRKIQVVFPYWARAAAAETQNIPMLLLMLLTIKYIYSFLAVSFLGIQLCNHKKTPVNQGHAHKNPSF